MAAERDAEPGQVRVVHVQSVAAGVEQVFELTGSFEQVWALAARVSAPGGLV